MNNKRQETNRQLSLGLEIPNEQSAVAAVCSQPTVSMADVLLFPSERSTGKSFRERVREDLVRNRVIVD